MLLKMSATSFELDAMTVCAGNLHLRQQMQQNLFEPSLHATTWKELWRIALTQRWRYLDFMGFLKHSVSCMMAAQLSRIWMLKVAALLRLDSLISCLRMR